MASHHAFQGKRKTSLRSKRFRLVSEQTTRDESQRPRQKLRKLKSREGVALVSFLALWNPKMPFVGLSLFRNQGKTQGSICENCCSDMERSTKISSLRSKRFQSSYYAKVRAELKKRLPSPSPVILFFCSCPSFLDEPREETLATQATKSLKSLRKSQFNPLNPNIKIQILICYPYTFSIEVVGRICWSIN